ncbi:hypothetical protein MSG28_016096, partial [Choristoneura fumiferana]
SDRGEPASVIETVNENKISLTPVLSQLEQDLNSPSHLRITINTEDKKIEIEQVKVILVYKGRGEPELDSTEESSFKTQLPQITEFTIKNVTVDGVEDKKEGDDKNVKDFEAGVAFDVSNILDKSQVEKRSDADDKEKMKHQNEDAKESEADDAEEILMREIGNLSINENDNNLEEISSLDGIILPTEEDKGYETSLTMTLTDSFKLHQMRYSRSHAWEWTFHYITEGGSGAFRTLAAKFLSRQVAYEFYNKIKECVLTLKAAAAFGKLVSKSRGDALRLTWRRVLLSQDTKVSLVYKCHACGLCFDRPEILLDIHLSKCSPDMKIVKTKCACGLVFDQYNFTHHCQVHRQYTALDVKKIVVRDEKNLDVSGMKEVFMEEMGDYETTGEDSVRNDQSNETIAMNKCEMEAKVANKKVTTNVLAVRKAHRVFVCQCRLCFDRAEFFVKHLSKCSLETKVVKTTCICDLVFDKYNFAYHCAVHRQATMLNVKYIVVRDEGILDISGMIQEFVEDDEINVTENIKAAFMKTVDQSLVFNPVPKYNITQNVDEEKINNHEIICTTEEYNNAEKEDKAKYVIAENQNTLHEIHSSNEEIIGSQENNTDRSQAVSSNALKEVIVSTKSMNKEHFEVHDELTKKNDADMGPSHIDKKVGKTILTTEEQQHRNSDTDVIEPEKKISYITEKTPAEDENLENITNENKHEEKITHDKIVTTAVNTIDHSPDTEGKEIVNSIINAQKINVTINNSIDNKDTKHLIEENKTNEIQEPFNNAILQNDVDVIVLTETWLRTDDEVKRAELDDYKHYFSIRNGKDGGGVSIYAKANLLPSLTVSKYQGGINFLWVHLNTEGLDIGGIYNPGGDTDGMQFLKEYSDQLKQMREAIVFGDFNIDLLKSESKTRNYLNTLDQAGFILLNKIHVGYSTRKTETSSTIIDHASSNLNSSEYKFHLAITASESDSSPRNNEPRWNPNKDTRQVTEDSSAASNNRDTTGSKNASESKTRRSKRNPAEKEFMCQFCENLYVYPMNYIKHLNNVHGYTGRVDDYSIVRRCPNCRVPCRRKAYNRHVRRCTEYRNKHKSFSQATTSTRVRDDRGDRDSDGQSSRSEDRSSNGRGSSDDNSSNDNGSSSGDDSSSSGDDSSSSDDEENNCDDAKKNAYNIMKELISSSDDMLSREIVSRCSRDWLEDSVSDGGSAPSNIAQRRFELMPSN